MYTFKKPTITSWNDKHSGSLDILNLKSQRNSNKVFA